MICAALLVLCSLVCPHPMLHARLTFASAVSDVIAMSVVQAVAGNGGPVIPFRAGRVDAAAAGPAGVPQPHESIESHTEAFRRQVFSPSEMIQLVR
jgi:hypothetical protein